MSGRPSGSGKGQQGWLRQLAGTLRPYRRSTVLAFGAALVGTAVAAATPLIERRILDRVVVAHREALAPLLVLLLGAGVVRFAAAFVRRSVGGALSLDVQRDLRDRVYESLQRLDFGTHDGLRTGQLVSRASSDITLIQGLLGFLPMATGNLLLFVLSIAIMAALSPLLTVVALLVAPLLVLIALRTRRTVFPASWDAQQQQGEVAGVVEEAVTGVRVVKGFGQEDREIARLAVAARRLFAARLRSLSYSSVSTASLQAVPALGQVAVLALGGWLALHGRITLGTFLAFTTYLGELVAPVRTLAGLLTVGQQARAGVVRVFEILDTHPRIVDAPDALPLPEEPVEVVFEDVRFGYLPSEPVLTGVSLRIAAGETLAVVGSSGSGKSTLAMLLPRFYDVQHGAVRISGRDVRSYTLDSLRRGIGVVFEESFLFSDTVRANIAYGRPSATDQQVRAAARAAQADRFVTALPEGYDTVVGENGLTLSGGQRQRLALARALVTDPRLLILDDATSAVDAGLEEEIHATLAGLMRGRTTLLIAHRRSTLRLADRVCLLNHGRLVDVGTEAELTERSPLFRALVAGEDLDRPLLADPAPPPAVTAWLWVRAEEPDRRLLGGARAGPALAAGLGRGGVPGGGMFGALPATPELLAAVDALPAATAVPGVAVADAGRPDPQFRFRHFLRPFRRWLLVGLALVALDALGGLAGPAFIRQGVDGGVSGHRPGVLLAVSAGFLAVTVLDWAVSIAATRITGRTGERALFSLRVKSFAQLQRLGLDFYERELAGRLMTRMTTDIEALSQFLQTGLTTAVVSTLSFVGVGVALVVLDGWLALIVLSVAVPLVTATVLFRSASARAYTRARDRIATVNAALQESLSGVRVTQAFVREDRNAQGFGAVNEGYRNARMHAQRLVALYFPFVEFLAEIAAALVLGFGASRVAHGQLSVGVLIAFLLYLDQFFSPVQQLSQVFDGYQQARVGLDRIGQLLRTPTSTPVPADPVHPGRLRGEVRFENVALRYPGASQDALRQVNLTVRPGETVAFVGPTGAGKSSLVKLVARYYDVTSGRVRVDGYDVRELDPSEYRRQLGVVPQEPFLFAGSIRDTIAYGRPDATDAEVEAAARAVGAHTLVERLPGGYLHVLGERGRSLSAGERQLLALARALLVDPAVLLLDEATATLDLLTEAAVNRAMAVASRARTTLVIAHRLSTAAGADRVVVLDAGRIVQVGTHAELLERDGLYARMWAAYAGLAA